ncbi:MAG: alpha-hydroxy acid oxidase, partial [Pseudomonadota bacterium]|nr:alpha-hydroxy acid oxidase [Pseudomonadota bacterium]
MKVDDCINLDDLRILAKKRVPKLIYDFIEGGSEDEAGLVRNEDAFRNRALVPRYMVDITTINQETELFGRTYSSAYGIAPTGGISNYRHQGDLMLARAARDANVPFIMSGAATAKMEDMARECPDHGWYQLYTAKDRSISDDQIKRAHDLGIQTLVITVDVPASGNRERNKRNGFGRPLKLTWECKFNALKHPLWMKDSLTYGIAMLANWEKYAPEGSSPEQVGEFVSDQFPAALVWKD